MTDYGIYELKCAPARKRATDEERREEVARRLREIRPCKSGHINWWEIARALGLKQPAGWFGWEKFEPDNAHLLADLIEPGEPKVMCVAEIKVDGERLEEMKHEVIQELQGEGQGMRHEFLATIIGIVDGVPNEVDIEPPAIVSACGLSGDEVDFSLRGVARRDAAGWFGRRVRVTVETMGDE